LANLIQASKTKKDRYSSDTNANPAKRRKQADESPRTSEVSNRGR
jgi:hypothetical protein